MVSDDELCGGTDESVVAGVVVAVFVGIGVVGVGVAFELLEVDMTAFGAFGFGEIAVVASFCVFFASRFPPSL